MRVDWLCPKCEYENRAVFSEAGGEIVCQKCRAVSVWQDVLSGTEILNLIGSVPTKIIENDVNDVAAFLEEKRFCPICGGELVWMGDLGKKTWYRCKGCGVDVAQETHEQNSISG